MSDHLPTLVFNGPCIGDPGYAEIMRRLGMPAQRQALDACVRHDCAGGVRFNILVVHPFRPGLECPQASDLEAHVDRLLASPLLAGHAPGGISGVIVCGGPAPGRLHLRNARWAQPFPGRTVCLLGGHGERTVDLGFAPLPISRARLKALRFGMSDLLEKALPCAIPGEHPAPDDFMVGRADLGHSAWCWVVGGDLRRGPCLLDYDGDWEAEASAADNKENNDG